MKVSGKSFHTPSKVTICREGFDEDIEEFHLPDIQKMYDVLGITHDVSFNFEGSEGFLYEVEHVMYCIRNNLTESPIVPLDDSMMVIHIVDDLQRRIGVEYVHHSIENEKEKLEETGGQIRLEKENECEKKSMVY